jgi:protein phosphatase
MAAETGAFTAKILSEDSKRYLERLPLSIERRLREHTFYLCHATPSDPLFGYLDKDSAQWNTEVEATVANVVVTGHTHVPFIRKVNHQTLVNPGSIGQPKTGTPDACYAIWEDGRVELHRYLYPVADTESEIRAMPVSEAVKADLIQALKTGGVSASPVSR